MNRQELIAIRLKLIERHFIFEKKPTLIAVSKRSPFSDVKAAYDAGLRDFGENRVDELLEKADQADEQGLHDIRWHFIGNLQGNKVNKLLQVKKLHAIHSIDSSKLLDQLLAKDFSGRVRLFLQVNTSNEKEKGGFRDWDELALSANKLIAAGDDRFPFYGLMTMSRLRTNNFKEDARKCFKQLKVVGDSLIRDFDLDSLKYSMGMSDDYDVALEEGTDYVRIGSLIFSEDPNAR